MHLYHFLKTYFATFQKFSDNRKRRLHEVTRTESLAAPMQICNFQCNCEFSVQRRPNSLLLWSSNDCFQKWWFLRFNRKYMCRMCMFAVYVMRGHRKAAHLMKSVKTHMRKLVCSKMFRVRWGQIKRFLFVPERLEGEWILQMLLLETIV